MGWRDNVLDRLSRKSYSISHFPPWQRAVFNDYQFSHAVEVGYRKQAVVYACLSVHSFLVPEAPLRVYESDERNAAVLNDHPARLLLASPNDHMGEKMLAAFSIVYSALGGQSYLWKQRFANTNQVEALWPLSIAQLTPVPDPDGWIKEYRYDVHGGQDEIGVSSQVIPVEDVITLPWPTPNPRNPLVATPPLLAVYRHVDSYNELVRMVYAMLKNDAMPRTVVKVQAELSDRAYKRLQNQFDQSFGGLNIGKSMLVEGPGADIDRLSAGLGELAAESLYYVPEGAICGAFRVPPILAMTTLGLSRNTFANNAEARVSYTEDFRVPLYNVWQDQFRLGLMRREYPGDKSIIRYDTLDVAALKTKSFQELAVLTAAVGKPFLTGNEARDRLGLGHMDGLDELHVPQAPPSAPMEIKGHEGEVLDDERAAYAAKVLPKIEAEFENIQGLILERMNGRYKPNLTEV